MVYQILETEDGKAMGTVEAPDVYSAAVQASTRLFKAPGLPFRETGWAGKSGTFAVQTPDGGRGRKFYVRVPT
jgi:hypothetical protein